MELNGTNPTKVLKSISKIVLLRIRNSSWWSDVSMAPPDAIFGITEAYIKNTNATKINVGVGAYRNDEGKPHVLQCVRAAEEKIKGKKMNKEYQPITGQQEFRKAAIELALGKDSSVIQNGLIATVQSLSGTGALRLGGDFIAKFHKGSKSIWAPNPTWGNHTPLFKVCGLKLEKYTYYDSKTCGFDFKGCLASINKIPEKNIILFHAVAHNPTGVDPNEEQWKEISALVKSKKLLPFFDMAYQGFASGNVDKDAFSVRHFIKDGHKIILAQSFSKNMGLYGERVGTLTVTADTKENAAKIISQLKLIIRLMYSNPPCNGSRIVTEVLTEPTLYKLWLKEVKEMADRIINIRKRLRTNLEVKEKSSKNWEHITNQIGMFCYTGMTPDQVANITKEYSIFLTKDGRISMAGVSSKNIDYLSQAIHAVTK